MLKRHRFHGFLRFLFSYLLVLIVPITLLLLLVYGQVNAILTDEILINNTNNLFRVKEAVEQQYRELLSVSRQVVLSNDTHAFNLADDPLRALRIKSALNVYRLTNQSIYDLFLYMRSDERVYSSTTTMSAKLMTESVISIRGWPYETFRDDMNALAGWEARPVSFTRSGDVRETRAVAFLFPLIDPAKSSSNVYGTLIIFVRETFFDQLMFNALPGHDGTTVILDRNGEVLYSTAATEGQRSALPEEWDDGVAENGMITLADERYLVSTAYAEASGFRLIRFVSAEQVLEKTNRLRTIMLTSLAVVTVLGSVLIYFLMQVNYSPIGKLLDYVSTIYRPTHKSSGMGMVREAIVYLTNENQLLLGRLDAGNRHAATDVLLRLVNGSFDDEQDFSAQCAQAGIQLDGTIFTAAVVYASAHKAQAARQALLEILSRDGDPHIHVYMLAHADANKSILLLSMGEYGSSHLTQWLKALAEDAAALADAGITVGVGRFYSNRLDMRDAYADALTALEHRYVRGAGGVVRYADTQAESFLLSQYPRRHVESIRWAVLQRNTAQVDSALLEIQQFFQENNPPLYIAKSLFLEIMWAIVSTMGDEALAVAARLSPMMGETVEESMALLRQLCEEIMALPNLSAEVEQRDFVAGMQGYVMEHYCNPDFSIKSAAAHFGMTVPLFSNRFKSLVGMTFIDYVSAKKTERAKQLLREGDKTLAEIAAQVGYTNVSSFIRRFKQITGVTPGEYQQKHTQK